MRQTCMGIRETEEGRSARGSYSHSCQRRQEPAPNSEPKECEWVQCSLVWTVEPTRQNMKEDTFFKILPIFFLFFWMKLQLPVVYLSWLITHTVMPCITVETSWERHCQVRLSLYKQQRVYLLTQTYMAVISLVNRISWDSPIIDTVSVC